MAVFIGDSYTAGAGGSGGGFASIVANANQWRHENLGRGGTGFITVPSQDPTSARNACGLDYCESYPEMIPAAVALNPSIVIVSGGRNNAGSAADVTAAAINAFFTDLRAQLPNARIIVTSPIWDDDVPPESLSAIAAETRSAAERVGAEYIDLGQPLADRPDLLSPDGVHPNDDGYRAIADLILAST